MKKLILNWLFGTKNVKRYMGLLEDNEKFFKQEKERLTNELLESVARELECGNKIMKLTQICKDHGIDIDQELN